MPVRKFFAGIENSKQKFSFTKHANMFLFTLLKSETGFLLLNL